MTNAWTLVLSSSIPLGDVEAVTIDDGREIRILPGDKLISALSTLEILPLRLPDFAVWTHDHVWTPDRRGVPLYLEKRPRNPEAWATAQGQYPTVGAAPVIADIKAVARVMDLAELAFGLAEDRLEILTTAPVLERAGGGDPAFNVGLVRIDGGRVELMVPDSIIEADNVDLSLLKRLALYDDAARRLRQLLELRAHLTSEDAHGHS